LEIEADDVENNFGNFMVQCKLKKILLSMVNLNGASRKNLSKILTVDKNLNFLLNYSTEISKISLIKCDFYSTWGYLEIF